MKTLLFLTIGLLLFACGSNKTVSDQNNTSEKPISNTRLHDIWVLTHIKGSSIKSFQNPPNMELNIASLRVMGFGGCNQYGGTIVSTTATTITFGDIMATEMACDNLATESTFLNELQGKLTYSIKNLTLLFYNDSSTEVLRFKKVD